MERTKEQQDAIIERIKQIMKDNNLTQKQLGDKMGVSQNAISRYLNGTLPIGDGFIYNLILNILINPRWLEFGENPVYLSPSIAQNNENNGGGTQINNIHGDNNVNMTLPKEAWDMLQSQQETIKSQQESVHMAQVNMMEIIKTFTK